MLRYPKRLSTSEKMSLFENSSLDDVMFPVVACKRFQKTGLPFTLISRSMRGRVPEAYYPFYWCTPKDGMRKMMVAAQ
jgi:hypothetical protein